MFAVLLRAFSPSDRKASGSLRERRMTCAAQGQQGYLYFTSPMSLLLRVERAAGDARIAEVSHLAACLNH
jgi:hypothetical protein